MIEEKEETKPKKSSNFQKWVRIISIIVFLAIIIVIVIVANVSESFSLGPAIIIGAGFFILFALVFFSFNIKHLIQGFGKKEKETLLPKAIKEQQAFELIENKFKTKHYADYINEVYSGGAEVRGKPPLTQWIFTLYFKTLYSKQKYFCGLNMHYPELGALIILNPTPSERATAKRHLVTNPEEEPDIEETSAYIQGLGMVPVQRRLTHKKKTKSKEEKGDIK